MIIVGVVGSWYRHRMTVVRIRCAGVEPKLRFSEAIMDGQFQVADSRKQTSVAVDGFDQSNSFIPQLSLASETNNATSISSYIISYHFLTASGLFV